MTNVLVEPSFKEKFKSNMQKKLKYIGEHAYEIISGIIITCIVLKTVGYFIRSIKMRKY